MIELIACALGGWTLHVIPDTQGYVRFCDPVNAAIYQEMMDYSAQQQPTYVQHAGDVITDPRNPCEWQYADTAAQTLENAGVSWSASWGNHDLCIPWFFCGDDMEPTEGLDDWFPPSRWAGDPAFGGSFSPTSMEHSWHEFTASGQDWLVVNVGFWQPPKPDALAWARSIIEAHPNHLVIVGQHSILWGDSTWTNEGTHIWNALNDLPNLRIMLCGHRYDDEHGRRAEIVGDHVVQVILINYQNPVYPNGGDGYLMEIVFDGLRADARTYSPWLDQESPHPEASFAFSLGPPGDVTADGVTDVEDMLAVLAAWGLSGVIEDVDASNVVDIEDLLFVLQYM